MLTKSSIGSKEKYIPPYATVCSGSSNQGSLEISLKHKTPSKIRILVTGVGGGGIGSQILKALRMSKNDYCIVGADVTPISKGLMEVDRPYLLPRGTDPTYIDQLMTVCKQEDINVLFPGSDPELFVISKHRDRILSANIFLPIQPESVIDIL